MIDTNSGGAAVRKLAPMNYARVFHNSVVLPNGQVVIIGGQTRAAAFTDDRSVLAAELFDPASETFTVLPAMTVPRNYHGVSLLMPDARVITSGGGLCGAGCAANHPDVQILAPYYLFNPDGTPATRPVITAAPAQAGHGTAMAVTTNAPIASFSLVRMGSTTHTVNNDQRRIPLAFSTTGSNSYSVQVPSNTGIALPGLYMLFAMNADGVPSVARIVRVGGTGTPQLTWPGDQSSTTGGAVSLTLVASGATSYGATGLPPGVTLNTSSGALSGAPTTQGNYNVTVSASNANGTVSTQLVWRVLHAGQPALRAPRIAVAKSTATRGRRWPSSTCSTTTATRCRAPAGWPAPTAPNWPARTARRPTRSTATPRPSGTRSGRPPTRRTRIGSRWTWARRHGWAASATCRARAAATARSRSTASMSPPTASTGAARWPPATCARSAPTPTRRRCASRSPRRTARR